MNYEIIEVNMENIGIFHQLVSPYALSGFDIEEKFGIGVLDGSNLPVALLVFSYAEETETTICACLDWLYVLEDYRRQGIASMIFDIFLDTVRTFDVSAVTCRFRDIDKEMGLGDFLARQGFTMVPSVSETLLIYQEQLFNAPIIRKDISKKGVRRLCDLERMEMKKLSLFFSKIKGPIPDVGSLDKELSLVYLDNEGFISGALLVKSDCFGNIEPVMMYSVSGGRKAVNELIRLLHYEAVTLLNEKYEGSWIRISIKKEKVQKLVDYLMPNALPWSIYQCTLDM